MSLGMNCYPFVTFEAIRPFIINKKAGLKGYSI
jgi:hypothetical protein